MVRLVESVEPDRSSDFHTLFFFIFDGLARVAVDGGAIVEEEGELDIWWYVGKI